MSRTMHGTRNFARDTGGYVRKDKIRTYDRQEQINACLSCTEPRCSGDRCRHLTGRGQATQARTDTRRTFGRDARHYVYEGKAYTAGELAAIAGVLTRTIHDRIYRGWTVGEAVRGARDGKKKKGYNELYLFRGEYRTAKELAAIAGMTSDAMRSRLRRGMDPETAVTTPLYRRGDGR